MKLLRTTFFVLSLTAYKFVVAEQAWQYKYDVDGNISEIDGPRTDLNDVTTFVYDEQGLLKSTTNAANHTVTFNKYNKLYLPEEIVDENSVKSLLSYDVLGNITRLEIVSPDGIPENNAITSYSYDAFGNLETVTFPDNSFMKFEYDAADRLVAIINMNNERHEFTLDAAGNIQEELIKNSASELVFKLNKEYDKLGRLHKVINARGNASTLTYDGFDNILDSTNAKENTTRNTHDELNRLAQLEEPNTATTSFVYDAFDRLTSVTDARSLSTKYVYDAFGGLKERHSPDTGTSLFEYDEAGNLTRSTDQKGVVANYSYDALNRLTSVQYPEFPEENIAYEYDDISAGEWSNGQLSAIRDQYSAQQFTYDHRGNVLKRTVRIETQVYVFEYKYDLADKLIEVKYPSGRLEKYSYNTLGQLSGISSNGVVSSAQQSIVSNIEYAPFGPLTSFKYGNDIVTNYDYGLDYMLDSQHSLLFARGLNYDEVGNITAYVDQLNAAIDANFQYDEVSKLVVAETQNEKLTFAYDLVGNRETQVLNKPSGVLFTHFDISPDSNRLNSKRQGNNACVNCYDKLGESVNLALNKPSSQSSDYSPESSAEKAVDGNTNGKWNKQSVAHTGWEDQPWWQVDLESVYAIAYIKLFNRTDCCSERLSNFYILVSETPFASSDLESELARDGVYSYHHAGSVGEAFTLPLSAKGRYVRIQLADEFVGLGLAEVQVMSDNGNVARLGEATQSSDYDFTSLPVKAIDGNSDGNWLVSSVAHTGWEDYPWWQLNLKSSYNINSIKLFNRTDCCRERLTNFYVLISSSPFSSNDLETELSRDEVTSFYHAGSVDESVELSINTQGQYIRIQLNDAFVGLGLAEVQVFSADANEVLKGVGEQNTQYIYDDNGQVTEYGDISFSYNAQNRLVESRRSGSTLAGYGHNALGQRVVKTLGDVKTHYAYDLSGLLVAEYDGATGAVLREYIYLNQQPLAVIVHDEGASLYYVHNDHLGTPQVLSGQGQQVVWRVESQSPFGVVSVDEDVDGDGNALVFNLRFPGQYFDEETGLSYNYYRTYDPGLGRYIQSDPTGLYGGINTYGYSYQNPINYFDPTGEIPIVAACALNPACVTAVAGGVTAIGLTLYNIGQVLAHNSNSNSGVQYWDPAATGSGTVTASPQCPPNDPLCQQQQNDPRHCSISNKQLQKKWKHANQFGVNGNQNTANLNNYRQAIQSHIQNPNTQIIQGTYRWNIQGTHFYNPNTGLWVFRSSNGSFHSGWQLSSRQVADLLSKANVY